MIDTPRVPDLAASRHTHQQDLLARLLRGCFGDLDDAALAALQRRLEWVELPGGATLMQEGDAADALYVSVSGRLRAYARDDAGVPRMVREMSRGQVIGEMSLFTGEPRSATVVAIRETVLVRLARPAFDELVERHPGVSAALARQLVQRMLRKPLRSLTERPVTMGLVPVSAGVDVQAVAARLAAALGRHGRVRCVDAAAVAAELAAHGLTLADDSAAASGGLAAHDDGAAADRRVADNDDSAVANRPLGGKDDSAAADPDLARTDDGAAANPRLAGTDDSAAANPRLARTDDSASANRRLARTDDSAAANRRLALVLDEIEADNEFVLLIGDAEPTPWTLRCTRHCDELLLLADAGQPPALHATEQRFLLHRAPGAAVTEAAAAAEILVLLHGTGPRVPQQTTRWLARRPLADHVHVRLSADADFARLARLQSRTAIGLVLAGGGARGFAHLGVLRALHERGIAVDCVGGTSIGAVMGALVASDEPLPRAMDIARRAFALDPTRDFNPLPLLSFIKGVRLQRVVAGAVRELLGDDVRIEDLRKGFFCVATNYSKAAEEHIASGPLVSALLASTAIPGALPPVLRGGDILCDGGTFNNFPVDVMQARRGVGTVIGIDLGVSRQRTLALDEMPGWWALALDRLRPRTRRRFALPSLASYLMNVTTLYSASRRAQSRAGTDLWFNPPLERVGLLQWRQFDSIVQQGYDHAVQVLDGLDAGLLARLGSRLGAQ